MDTHFAPSERASLDVLTKEVQSVSSSPVVSGMMTAAGGLIAVLNEQRQIIALNETMLKLLGVNDAEKVLGLRLGEAIHCVHAHDMPGGCGTSEYCPTCGAAIAMVTALGADRPVEQRCAATVERDGHKVDLFLRVRSAPFELGERRFLLIFLQDISRQQRWAYLERIFFHDISNLIGGLVGAVEIMEMQAGKPDYSIEIRQLSLALAREVELHKRMAHTEGNCPQAALQRTNAREILAQLKLRYKDHPAAGKSLLVMPRDIPDIAFSTDPAVLLRILGNMVVNAYEASDSGDQVRVSVEPGDGFVTFSVWNRQVIPGEIGLRVFQRNFSTKDELGRGLGTYSMKYLGEEILGGAVSFTSTAEEGTTFRFRTAR